MITTSRHGQSIWEHLGDGRYDDWRQVIAAAGQVADETSAPLPAVRALEAVIARVASVDPALHRALTNAALDQAVGIFDAALMLGAALARSWPGSLDAMATWPAQALAEAGLDAELAPSPAEPAPPTSSDPSTSWTAPAGASYGRWVTRAEDHGDDWRDFVATLACGAFEDSPVHAALDGAYRRLVERVMALDRDLALDLDEQLGHRWIAAARWSALLGYGLARTASGPEAFDGGWLDRARAYVGDLEDRAFTRPAVLRTDARAPSSAASAGGGRARSRPPVGAGRRRRPGRALLVGVQRVWP